MKALVLETAEGPESAGLIDVDTPTPGKGEVRVALKAAALNHRELWISRGLYPGMKLPSILGADGAGVIESLAEGVDDSMLNQQVILYPAANWGGNPDYPANDFCVLGMPEPGTLAEYIVVPADSVAAIPAGLDFAQAACVPLAGLTMWRALRVKAGVGPGDKVLITGIGGGVASLGLLMAKAMGAEVFVTSSSDDKIEQAVAMGATAGINYNTEKWGKELVKRSGGVDVVIDGSPAGSYGQYGRAVSMGARVVIYGSTGGMQFSVTATDLFLRHATIYGSAMGSPEDFRQMVAFFDANGLQPMIEKTFSLEAAADALLYLDQNHQMGKVAVSIG